MQAVLLNRSDVAKLLNLSLRTIDSLLARGELKTRKVGRRVLIPRQDVERFARMASTTKGTRSAEES
jgi:excisionase family DNA binding protein